MVTEIKYAENHVSSDSQSPFSESQRFGNPLGIDLIGDTYLS